MDITRSVKAKAEARNNLVSLIPLEIIEWEILPRLPAKSLVRYKSVRKSWNLLISSDHDFIKSHFDLNPNKDSLILEHTYYYSYRNSFISEYSMSIVGCIDGLVCVFHCHNNDSKILQIAIWNPALNRCLVLPPSLKKGIEPKNVLLGFGFDSDENDFKVMYGDLIEEQPLEVNVYSCKAACWKMIAPSNIFYSGEIYKRTEPTIVNGSPFWLIEERQDAKISLLVIWFDVRHEVFRSLPSVDCIDNSVFRTCDLMNFRDSFAIMVYDRGAYFVEPIDVHTFNHECGVWDKILSIGPFICKEPNVKLHRLIPCSRNGETIFVNWDGCRLYGVNSETHTIKILKEGSSQECILNCFNYSESLLFIEGMEPVYGLSDGGRFKFLLRERLELAPSYEYTTI